MTYKELVRKVQSAVAKSDASKVRDHIAVQVNVTGEAAGAFYMEISGGVLYVAPYDYNDRDALLTGSAEDILSVVEGKVTLEEAIANGTMAHEGNYEKALTLGATFPKKRAGGRKPADAPKSAETEEPKQPRKPRAGKKTAEPAPADAEVIEEIPEEKPRRGRKPRAISELEAVTRIVEEPEEPVEEKPKRGRKPKADPVPEPVEEKPKRGRKPKAESVPEPVEEKPKRGRKPKKS